MEYVIAGLGSFIAMLLMVNAFFTRQTLQAITEVRLELAKLIVKHDMIDERSRKNEHDIEEIRRKLSV